MNMRKFCLTLILSGTVSLLWSDSDSFETKRALADVTSKKQKTKTEADFEKEKAEIKLREHKEDAEREYRNKITRADFSKKKKMAELEQKEDIAQKESRKYENLSPDRSALKKQESIDALQKVYSY